MGSWSFVMIRVIMCVVIASFIVVIFILRVASSLLAAVGSVSLFGISQLITVPCPQ